MTEIKEVARRLSDIERRDVKVVGFSRNEESRQWNELLDQYQSDESDAGRGIQIVCRYHYCVLLRYLLVNKYHVARRQSRKAIKSVWNVTGL